MSKFLVTTNRDVVSGARTKICDFFFFYSTQKSIYNLYNILYLKYIR